jgi:hypothetical protein
MPTAQRLPRRCVTVKSTDDSATSGPRGKGLCALLERFWRRGKAADGGREAAPHVDFLYSPSVAGPYYFVFLQLSDEAWNMLQGMRTRKAATPGDARRAQATDVAGDPEPK